MTIPFAPGGIIREPAAPARTVDSLVVPLVENLLARNNDLERTVRTLAQAQQDRQTPRPATDHTPSEARTSSQAPAIPPAAGQDTMRHVDIQADYDATVAKLQKAQAQRDQAQARFEEAQRVSRDHSSQVQILKRKLKDKSTAHTAALEMLHNERAATKHALDKADEARAKTLDKLDNLHLQLAEAQKRAEAAEKHLAEVKNEAEETNRGLTAKLAQAEADLKKSRETDAAVYKDFIELEKKKHDAAAELLTAKATSKKLTDQLKQAEANLAQALRDHDELAGLLDESEKTRAALTVENTRLKKTTTTPATPAAGAPGLNAKQLKKHVEAARANFEDDPDKCWRSLGRALALLTDSNDTEEEK